MHVPPVEGKSEEDIRECDPQLLKLKGLGSPTGPFGSEMISTVANVLIDNNTRALIDQAIHLCILGDTCCHPQHRRRRIFENAVLSFHGLGFVSDALMEAVS